jgi:CsoR family transcriptional regulator, copper-sensing transcriptional repressor
LNKENMATQKTTLQHKNAMVDSCACEVGKSERKAVGVDPELKASNLRRLRRLEGQIRGLQRMVEEERYCADILTQVSSVQEALRSVARALMRNHLSHCATQAIRSGSAEERQTMYDELLELIYKNAR